MNWKNHNAHTTPTLSRACYAIKRMYNFSNTETIIKDLLCIILILKYGIVFSGNSTDIKMGHSVAKENYENYDRG